MDAALIYVQVVYIAKSFENVLFADIYDHAVVR